MQRFVRFTLRRGRYLKAPRNRLPIPKNTSVALPLSPLHLHHVDYKPSHFIKLPIDTLIRIS
jgi:hypothetical protein